jgi:hypothetical protein
MATSQNIGKLELEVGLNIQNSLNNINQGVSKLVTSTDKLHNTLLSKDKVFEQKMEQQTKANQQKLLFIHQKALADIEAAQLKSQAKQLASNKSWSSKMSSQMGTLANSVKTLGAYFGLYMGVNAVKSSIDFARNLDVLAESLGFTTEQLQVINLEGAKVGIGVEDLQKNFVKLQSAQVKAQEGDSKTITNFKSLKLGSDRYSGSLGDLQIALLDNYKQILLTGTAQEKLAAKSALIEIYGNKSIIAIQKLTSSWSGWQRALSENKGNIISQKDIDNLRKISDQLDLIAQQFKIKLGIAFSAFIGAATGGKGFSAVNEFFSNIDFSGIATNLGLIAKALGNVNQVGEKAGVSFGTLPITLIRINTFLPSTLLLFKAFTGALIIGGGALNILVQSLAFVASGFSKLRTQGMMQNFMTMLNQLAAWEKAGGFAKAGFPKMLEGLTLLQKVMYGSIKAMVYFREAIAWVVASLGYLVNGFISLIEKIPFVGKIFGALARIPASILYPLIIAYESFVSGMKYQTTLFESILYGISKATSVASFGLTDWLIKVFGDTPYWKQVEARAEQLKEFADEYARIGFRPPELPQSPMGPFPFTGPTLDYAAWKNPEDIIDSIADIKKKTEEYNNLLAKQTQLKEHLASATGLDAKITKTLLDDVNKSIENFFGKIEKGQSALEKYKEVLSNLKKASDEYQSSLKNGTVYEQVLAHQALLDAAKKINIAWKDNTATLAQLNAEREKANRLEIKSLLRTPSMPLPTSVIAYGRQQDIYKDFKSSTPDIKTLRTEYEDLRKLIYNPTPGQEIKDPLQLKAIKKRFDDLYQTIHPNLAKITNTIEQYITPAIQTISQGMADYYNSEITQIQNLMDMENTRWALRSEYIKAEGLEVSTLHRNELMSHTKMVNQLTKQENGLKRKAWDIERLANITNAVMAGAVAFIKALPNIPLAIFTAAQTAVQIGFILAQKNPYRGLNKGGWVANGNSSNRDSVSANLTRGEFVVNREAAQRNADMLELMNRSKKRLQTNSGDTIIIKVDTFVGTQEFVNQTIVPAIKKARRAGYEV